MENYINNIFVDSEESYTDMIQELSETGIIALDCETVSKSALELFQEQRELELKLERLHNLHGDRLTKGIELLDNSKRLLKEYESYLRDRYKVKTISLFMLFSDHRELLKERRADVANYKKEYDFIPIYDKIMKSLETIQTKIEKNMDGLFFNKNVLSLVQIGTLNKQYLIDPKILREKSCFKNFLATRKAIVGHNLKFDLIQLHHHLGIKLYDDPVVCYDTMLAAKVSRSGLMRSFSLKSLSLEILNYDQSKEERVTNWLRRPLTDEQTKYASLDVIIPLILFKILRQEIQEGGLIESAQLQMDFLKVLTKMEMEGIYVDIDKTEELVKIIDKDLESRRKSLADKLGDEVWFNPEKNHNEIKNSKDLNSPLVSLKQLRAYGLKHGIKPLHNLVSTSAKSFEEIEENIDIIEEISEFRSLIHTKNSYCNAITSNHVDNRIHSDFTQLQKEGTRMSSSKPNIQNIARSGSWDKRRFATWEEAYESWTPKQKLRTLFIPTLGKKLYNADYSAIELCMVAYYSQDVMMLKSLTEGVDLHALSANRLFGLGYTYEDLKDENIIKEFKSKYGKERQVAKTFNFAVVYGAGAKKLRNQLMTEANIYDMEEEEIRTLKGEWLSLYCGTETWQSNTLSFVRHNGYCTTRMGRKIYYEDPAKVYSKAFNTPIQASCYEGLQRAAIIFNKRVTELTKENKIKEGSINIVNLVHDEILVEADENIKEESVINLIETSMKDGMQILMEEREEDGKIYERVPVRVEGSKILRWSDK